MVEPRSRTPVLAAGALVVVAAVLIVVHFALDAGGGREAPRWVIFAAIACGVAGALVGSAGRRRG